MSAVPQVPFCGDCGKPIRHNVPRLGEAGGWVHAETGSLSCAEPGGTCVVCGDPVPDGGKMGNSPIHLDCYTGQRAPHRPEPVTDTPLTASVTVIGDHKGRLVFADDCETIEHRLNAVISVLEEADLYIIERYAIKARIKAVIEEAKKPL